MTELDAAQRDFFELRDHQTSLLLATLGTENLPEASYAPFVWHEQEPYIFTSALAAHTRNLHSNPALGLLLLDDNAAGNAFARRRISLQAEALAVARDDPAFAGVMADFHDRFGQVMQIIEPLADFQLFRLRLLGGRFIRGFGQAYRLSGAGLTQLEHIDPRNDRSD